MTTSKKLLACALLYLACSLPTTEQNSKTASGSAQTAGWMTLLEGKGANCITSGLNGGSGAPGTGGSSSGGSGGSSSGGSGSSGGKTPTVSSGSNNNPKRRPGRHIVNQPKVSTGSKPASSSSKKPKPSSSSSLSVGSGSNSTNATNTSTGNSSLPSVNSTEVSVDGYFLDGSLDYSLGGANWGGQCLNTTYQQSPIVVPQIYTFSPVQFQLDVDISFANVRRYWVEPTLDQLAVEFRSDGFLRVDGVLPDMSELSQLYKPSGQMYFHTPAEHKFENADPYDVEMQIEFHSILDEKTYVSVFFNRTSNPRSSSAFINSLNLDDSELFGQENMVFKSLELNELFERLDQLSLWHYLGSLTQPPCTGGVHWFLFNDPQPISTSQLEMLQGYFNNNARASQPVINDFDVLRLSGFDVDKEGCDACCQWWL